MKNNIYLSLAIIVWTLTIICLPKANAQIIQTKVPLGAPIVVNFKQAAAYARLHPQNTPVHCAEVEGGEEEKEGTGEELPIGNNGVKNDVQLNNPNQRTQNLTSPAPSLTIRGYSLMTTFPPDINGAAGINHIVMTTNEGVMIFNKSGAALDSTNLKAFFPTASTVNNPGVSIAPYDPHCCYDPNNDRFIIVCSGFLPSSGHGGVFLAVSKTGDPTGNWWEYFLDGTGNTTDLFDYPELGFNTNWIVVTGNIFGGWTTFSDNKICVVDRAAAYNGTATGAIDIFTENTNGSVVTTISPALTDDNTQTTEWMVNNANGNTGGYGYVTLSTITGAVGSPVYTLVGSSVGVNQPWSNTVITAPQKGGSEGLNMGDARIRNAVYRNGSLYFTHHVFLPVANPTRTSTDWWQINPATQTVIQFGRIDDPGDTLNYIYPGIDVNSSGDVLLSFSETSSKIYTSAAYALHASGDALNYTEGSYIYKPGLSYYIRTDGNGNDRWGDFTGVAVDPTDGSFWCFSEWAQAETTWGTDVAHVNATPDTNCNAPVALDTVNLTQTSVTLEWTPISQANYFTIQYKQVGAGTWITDTTSATSFNVTGLTASTNYEFQVSNNCKSGSVSPYSSIFYFTTLSPCKTTAGFSASVTTFCSAPATVTFTNTSTNAASYYWTFGDGNNSTGASPQNTYMSYGQYSVTLIATGCTVDTLVKTSYINVDSSIACVVSLPTSGVGPVQTACEGDLYDSGGPTGNYQNLTDASITIAPLGAATVSITFVSFYYESNYDFIYVYNGPNKTYPLLGKYTGSTVPNGGLPISASSGSITIRQTSDDSINYSGFSATWQCTLSTVAPVANFTSNITTSCTGAIQFTDLSTEGPTSWLWDFGDGQTSPLQNPLHIYTTGGTFNVKLTATNSHGSNSLTQNSYVTISLPVTPTVTPPSEICSGAYTTISASGNPTITWYDSLTGGSALATGSPLITPPLSVTTTYYVESDQSNAPQHVGPAYTIGGATGQYLSTGKYYCEFLNCTTPVTLVSVVMYSQYSGPVRITLVQNEDTIQAATINITGQSATDTVFPLNFNIPIGTDLELGCTTATNLWINTAGGNYPYILPELLSITGNNAQEPAYYYYFYQWNVQEAACSSARVPVTVTVDQGPVISFTPDLNNSVCTFTNNTTGATQYSWNFDDPGSGANNVSTLQSPVHTFSTTGVFNVCLKATDSRGCKNTVCQDVTVLVLAAPAINGETNANLSVYPNPVTNELTIEFGAAYTGKKWTLKLTDILGKLIAEKDIPNAVSLEKYIWDLASVAKGVYLLTLQSEDEKLMRKIVRQ